MNNERNTSLLWLMLCLASVAIIGFSSWAQKVVSDSTTSGFAAAMAQQEKSPMSGSTSEEEVNARHSAIEKAGDDGGNAKMDETHFLVKAVSVPYFLLAAFFFIRHKAALSWMLLVGCIAMLVWSLVLGKHADFSETSPAWLIASVDIGVGSFFQKGTANALLI